MVRVKAHTFLTINFYKTFLVSDEKLQILTTPVKFQGSEKALMRLKWSFHKFKEVFFQSNLNDKRFKSEGGLFIVQVPPCPENLKQQGM